MHLESECCVIFVARQCRQIRLCLPGWAVSGGWGWAEFRVSLMTESGQEPQLNVDYSLAPGLVVRSGVNYSFAIQLKYCRVMAFLLAMAI